MATTRCKGKVKGTGRRCRNRVSGNRKRCPFHSGAAKTSICWPGYERVPGTKAYSKGSCRKVAARNPRRPRRRIVRDCLDCDGRAINALRCLPCKERHQRKLKVRNKRKSLASIARKRKRQSLPIKRCRGKTQEGKRCRRFVHGGRCPAHGG